MNINKYIDKKYEKLSFKQLAEAPYEALAGMSEEKAELLRKAFKKNELSKYVSWAEAIVTLAQVEE